MTEGTKLACTPAGILDQGLVILIHRVQNNRSKKTTNTQHI